MRERWSRGEAAFGAWSMLPSAVGTETIASLGFDYVCIDAQHGLIGYEDMLAMLQAMGRTPVTPVVRVPSNDFAWIGKALDAGAEGVIVPLVSSAPDAASAASACRYPPRGARSYGPTRAGLVGAADPQASDEQVACVVMIETREGLEAADEICSTPGVDAVYVGPSDLAISLGIPMSRAFEDAEHTAAIERVRAACEKAGIVAGVHCRNGEQARAFAERGFRMLTTCMDLGLLAFAAGAELKAARGAPTRTVDPIGPEA